MGRVRLADRSVAAIIRGRALEVRYRRRGAAAVARLDLEVRPGEVVGLMGPNGAGKSTVMRLLATLLRPTAGTLSILGNDARRPKGGTRRRIGFLPDDAPHADALSGRENAELFARAAGLPKDDAKQATAALLEQFGLDGDAERPVAEYSFGMRRKLAIVEALAHGPDLLLLDEPTIGLDWTSREALRSAIRERSARGGAVVMASNDTAEVARCCGRVLFMHRGAAVTDDAPQSLLSKLGAATRLEATLTRAPTSPVEVAGLSIALTTPEHIVAHSADGAAALPAFCAALLEAGAEILDVAVRAPDLSDAFLAATGTELVTR
jgi:ABC-2 type transport system ATP-binding protein